jgi:hypothetical protein
VKGHVRALAVALLVLAAPAARAGEDPAPTGWAAGAPRPFLAGRLDLGLHAGAVAAAGYGKPHWAWAGAQGSALVSTRFAAVEGGLRAVLPFLDLTVLARRTRSFDKPLLAPLARHREAELSGGAAHVTAIDASLSGVLPAPGGLALWEVALVRPLGLAADRHVFEETWKAIVGPRGARALRAGFLAGPWRGGALRLGPFGEGVTLVGRDVATLWRAGGVLAWSLGPHLTLVGLATLPVSGPDRLDPTTAAYGTLALRWTMATGDPAPGFP